MSDEMIAFLKSIYDINTNDGKIRNIVAKETKSLTEYTRIMMAITFG